MMKVIIQIVKGTTALTSTKVISSIKEGLNIQKGKFGVMLNLHIVNNRPVSFYLNF